MAAMTPLVPLPDLPAEIWIHISETHLSPSDRTNMMSLHRVFFELHMKKKYRNLSLVSKDPAGLVGTIESVFPIIIRFMRSLTICPEAVFHAVYAPSPELPQWWAPSRRLAMLKRTITSLEYLEELSVNVLEKPGGVDEGDNCGNSDSKRQSPEVEETLYRQAFPDFLRVLMQGWIWPAAAKCHNSLQEIKLNMDVLHLEDVVPGDESLAPRDVKVLDVALEYGSIGEAVEIPRDDGIITVFLPFLQRLMLGGFPGLMEGEEVTGLKHLAIRSKCDNIWAALASTETISWALLTLEIHIPEPPPRQPYRILSSVHHLVTKNAESLEELAVYIYPYECNTKTSRLAVTSMVESNPLPTVLAQQWNTMGRLRKLRVKLPFAPGKRADSAQCQQILDYLSRLGKGVVTNLDLENVFFTFRDLGIVLRALSIDKGVGSKRASNSMQDRSKLVKEVALRLLALTPEMIETLVNHCPRLVKLNLTYEAQAGNDYPDKMAENLVYTTRNYTLYGSESSFQGALYRRVGLSPSSYECKSLKELAILTYYESPHDLRYDLPLMRLFKRLFPSIKSFAGYTDGYEWILSTLKPEARATSTGRGPARN